MRCKDCQNFKDKGNFMGADVGHCLDSEDGHYSLRIGGVELSAKKQIVTPDSKCDDFKEKVK